MSATPGCDGWRDDSTLAADRSGCPVCTVPLPSRRARYCSTACKQRSYRLRQLPVAADDQAALRQQLQRRRALVAHTIYECPNCDARFGGIRRCPDCHRFCRALGLGGACPDCETPILLADLLDLEVLP